MLIKNILLMLLSVHCRATYDVYDDRLYQDGREQYEMIENYSNIPKYGDCWKNAIKNVKSGCKGLNDRIQTNLAIMFTYCLLKHLKYDLVECELIDLDEDNENTNLACYEKLKANQNSFTTFTEFFTHTQNICFFLQNQVWNEITLELVKESRKIQINLLQTVNKAVKTQEKLIETNSYLQEIINTSALNVQNVLEDFSQQTKSQQQAIFHLFDRLQQIQSYILGEFTLFYSVIFYIFTIIVAYVLTSTSRTQSARAGCFILLTSMLLTENFIVSISKKSTDINTFEIFGFNFNSNFDINKYIWLCRKFYINSSFVHLLISAFMHRDYNISNNKLLVDIKNDHNELKLLINEIKTNYSTPALLPIVARPLLRTTAVLTAESIRRSYLRVNENLEFDISDDESFEISTDNNRLSTYKSTEKISETVALKFASNSNVYESEKQTAKNNYNLRHRNIQDA